jgi:putative phosphotransacetylase
MDILIEVSARHVHLSQQDLEVLFGNDATLHTKRDLSQKGQFAAEETVTLVTKERTMNDVRIVGPVRDRTQVELAFSDAYRLGILPPVRISGDLDGAHPITIVGPKGTITDSPSAIVSQRHIHTNPEDARKLGVTNDQEVKIYVEGERSLTFEHVVIRIHEDFQTRLHLDTDEGNACNAYKTRFARMVQ